METGANLPPLALPHRPHITWAVLRSLLITQRARLALGVILAGGLALRLWDLSAKSLWIDETFSIGMATQGWRSFAHTIGVVQPNMELFYLLLKLAAWLTPAAWQRGEFFWRLLPALAGTATIAATYALARRLCTARIALLAATLVAINAFQVEYSQQARGYTLFVLLLTLSYLALVRWLEGEQRALTWFAALSALGFLTQAFEVVFLAAQLCFIASVAISRHWYPWKQVALALLPTALLVALRYPLYAAHPDQVAWIPRPTTTDLFHGARDLIGGDGGVARHSGTLLLLAVLAAILVLVVQAILQSKWKSSSPLRFWGRGPENGEGLGMMPYPAVALLLLTWLVIPILGIWLGSQVKPMWVTRYLAPASVAACIIVAVAAGALASWLRQRAARDWLFAGLAALALLGWLLPLRDYAQRPGWEDWRGAATSVNARFQPGDGIICYDNQWGCDFGFSHYFQSAGGPARFDPTAPGVFSWATYARPDRETIFARAVDPAYLAPYLARHGRVWVLLGHATNGAGNPQAGIAWLNAHAHLTAQTSFAGDIAVYLYTTGGNQPYVRSTP